MVVEFGLEPLDCLASARSTKKLANFAVAKSIFGNTVKSMSGWTKEFMGEPTIDWTKT